MSGSKCAELKEKYSGENNIITSILFRILQYTIDKIVFTVIPCIWIFSKFFYLPTDAQNNCFKEIIKIYIKTAPTCFGAITVIRERISRAC